MDTGQKVLITLLIAAALVAAGLGSQWLQVKVEEYKVEIERYQVEQTKAQTEKTLADAVLIETKSEAYIKRKIQDIATRQALWMQITLWAVMIVVVIILLLLISILGYLAWRMSGIREREYKCQ